MSIRRKLFLSMAAFIVGMGVIFALLTKVVVNDILDVMLRVDRSKEIEELSRMFADYYEKHHHSWNGVKHVHIDKDSGKKHEEFSILLTSPERKQLYMAGDASYESIVGLGVRSKVQVNGKTIAFLYYYDREVGNMSKLRMGITSSVTTLLLICAAAFVLLSLLVAFWLSKRLTAPLGLLIPAIDRLGKGEFGVQVPVVTNDEYGKVAQTFNEMSKQLQRAEEARKNLVADVAHELRTPLTIIRGKLDWFQQSGCSIEPESLLPLQDELIRLTRLVDDLHQLSLAEAGKLPLERKPTDMHALLQRLIERVTPSAEEKNIHIHMTCSTDKTTILVDPHRITQVFLNLLVNAIRYTPEGGAVKVTIDEEPIQNGESRMLRIAVADTGIGIAPEHLPLLFNRFYRTDEARTRNRGGTGLGLAIAKEFVLAHDGTIDVESAPGQGTTFIVKLPY
ncbi:HAMP domain-containing sensor histidine kinase [Saccharococcus caldoxylosilyticus]|uniref:HAMP domain-containing sensor histidine kinase n=1 Tax=Saccharococcus caldoxylosilyticus TaxID=81408 RepID=UPI0003747037|nr:ATP-binding protein [Parageobacillus caldoxylosilyticus]